MEDILERIADRYAKKAAKEVMRKISKIFYKAVKSSFKEGWIASEGAGLKSSFCEKECKLYDTEYRCRDCPK